MATFNPESVKRVAMELVALSVDEREAVMDAVETVFCPDCLENYDPEHPGVCYCTHDD